MSYKHVCLAALAAAVSAAPAVAQVNLSDEQVPFQGQASSKGSTNVYDKQWFQKIDISGNLGYVYARTGEQGSRPNGGLNNKQAVLTFAAQVWDAVSAELQWFPLGFHGNAVGEAYIHFKNVFARADNPLSLKVGRFDIPFGEEYVWQYFIDNPLILHSASFPWGWDGGIEAYGNFLSNGSLSYVLALTDGDFVQNADADDTHNSKMVTLKLYGNINDSLRWSASYLEAGKSASSSMWFGNNPTITPVSQKTGATCTIRTGGCSPGTMVDQKDWELDLMYKLPRSLGDLWGNYGQVRIIDDNPGFSRTLNYWTFQPLLNVTDKLYLVGRYSAITASDNGYKLGTGTTESLYQGYSDFNTKSFTMYEYGIGYMMNPNTRLVAEYATVRYEILNNATDPSNPRRDFGGIKAVVKF